MAEKTTKTQDQQSMPPPPLPPKVKETTKSQDQESMPPPPLPPKAEETNKTQDQKSMPPPPVPPLKIVPYERRLEDAFIIMKKRNRDLKRAVRMEAMKRKSLALQTITDPPPLPIE